MMAIMVHRSDAGTYEIPGAAEPEDWQDVQVAADEIEEYGPLKGWEPWETVYRIEVDGAELWYFVGPWPAEGDG